MRLQRKYMSIYVNKDTDAIIQTDTCCSYRTITLNFHILEEEYCVHQEVNRRDNQECVKYQ